MSKRDGQRRSLLARILNYEIISDRALSRFGLDGQHERTVERIGDLFVVCMFAFFTHLLAGLGAGLLRRELW